jgi:hypothetical protein
MEPPRLLVAMLLFGVPLAWFVAEFQDRRWLRLMHDVARRHSRDYVM